MFVNVSWPWFSFQLRTTGDVLDGAGNESNSTWGEGVCVCVCVCGGGFGESSLHIKLTSIAPIII